MARSKNKRAHKSVGFRELLLGPINLFIILASIIVAISVIAGNIPNLSYNERSKLINCNGQMRKIELYDSDIQLVHHYAKVYIWFAAIVLMLVSGFLIYRNSYWRFALVTTVILLLLYSLLGAFGTAFEGINCLSF